MRLLAVALVSVLLLYGCDARDRSVEPAVKDDAPHAHSAPHGGVLIEVGDHAANVELLLDAKAGTLTLWALGGHAESAVRLADKSIPVEVGIGESEMALRLAPVENALSGEKIGDTSEFSVTHEKLKGLKSVRVVIPRIVVRGAEGIVLTADVPAAP
ncbi:MAG: hypothetical protein ACYTG4_02425 [Planctomycetota bacterium]|jgi:hypothetical protein